MLKRERLITIKSLVEKKEIVTVSEINETLGVSTMTVRRDLDELAAENALIRIHGGAQSRGLAHMPERSHDEKRQLEVPAKTAIARLAADMIDDGDTIFIGSGTTLELIAPYIEATDVRFITNALQVFESFQRLGRRVDLQLIGGTYRARSGAFVGSLANEVLERLRFDKAFVGANGINKELITTTSPEEGQTLRIALKNAHATFVVCDHSKLDQQDFYTFYTLDQISGLITDDGADEAALAPYAALTTVHTAMTPKQGA